MSDSQVFERFHVIFEVFECQPKNRDSPGPQLLFESNPRHCRQPHCRGKRQLARVEEPAGELDECLMRIQSRLSQRLIWDDNRHGSTSPPSVSQWSLCILSLSASRFSDKAAQGYR